MPYPLRVGDGVDGLNRLVKVAAAHSMVEIGCAYGESTMIFAKHFDLVYAIDSWHHPLDDSMARFDEMNVLYPNVKKMRGFDTEWLYMFEDGTLDFVYIDASHDYESVLRNILDWKPKIKVGGMMGGHDYHPNWPGVMKAVTEVFGEPALVFMDTSWLVKL
jgi:predicted O-methyltransferase YrrM